MTPPRSAFGASPRGSAASGPTEPAARRPLDRPPRRAVHGVLLLDKPEGLSSSDAVQRARRLYRAEKCGHTGTLDPLASGLLPLCFGAATKFSACGLEADKRYQATLRLGCVSSTGDGEGDITSTGDVRLDRVAIDAVLAGFTGTIEQTPPMHSALKHEGRALYKYARDGVEVARAPRRISVHRIEVLQWQAERLVLDVHCGKGTYIRTLAADIGAALGCGAYLSALRRTASGALRLEDAVTLEHLEALNEAERDALLRPADALLADWPPVLLPPDDAARFLTGLRRRVALADAAAVRVYGPSPDGGRRDAVFLGSAHIAGGELIAGRLLSPAEVAHGTGTHP